MKENGNKITSFSRKFPTNFTIYPTSSLCPSFAFERLNENRRQIQQMLHLDFTFTLTRTITSSMLISRTFLLVGRDSDENRKPDIRNLILGCPHFSFSTLRAEIGYETTLFPFLRPRYFLLFFFFCRNPTWWKRRTGLERKLIIISSVVVVVAVAFSIAALVIIFKNTAPGNLFQYLVIFFFFNVLSDLSESTASERKWSRGAEQRVSRNEDLNSVTKQADTKICNTPGCVQSGEIFFILQADFA